jgi:hypothetical protein
LWLWKHTQVKISDFYNFDFNFQQSLGVIIGIVHECPGDKGFSKTNPQMALKHISRFADQLMKYNY